MDAAEGDSVLFTHMVNRADSNNFSPFALKELSKGALAKEKGAIAKFW